MTVVGATHIPSYRSTVHHAGPRSTNPTRRLARRCPQSAFRGSIGDVIAAARYLCLCKLSSIGRQPNGLGLARAFAGHRQAAAHHSEGGPWMQNEKDHHATTQRRRGLGLTFRIPPPAPVGFPTNFLRQFRDREKAQLPQAFAAEAWGFASGMLRQIALRMPICLRSLGLGRFTLQAFSAGISEA